MVISTTGTLKAWGWGAQGQLGYGNTLWMGNSANEMGNYLALIDVGSGYIVSSVSSGKVSEHSCALLENGTDFLGLKCWGQNSQGQLGLGDSYYRGDDINEMGDDLPFIIFSALRTNYPTTMPTVDPSHEPTKPTIEPTENPTENPSTDPSEMPSKSPSRTPTSPPTTEPVCIQIRVDIIDFDGFDSDQLNEDKELQYEVANMTHYALSRTAITTDYSIDADNLYVIFDDSDTVYLYDDGQLQKSLFIYETLCALQEDDLVILSEIIQSQCDVVNQLMADKLNTLYLNGRRADSLKVSISDLSQLRLFVLLRCHDQVNK